MKEFLKLGRLESNIWKYAVMMVANKRIFAAILSVYYLTIPDVTVWWVGIFLMIGNLAGFIFEIPSGYISDKMGHKSALVMSSVLMVISTSFFLFANSIPFLIIGSIFLNLSVAFHSGTGSAFMHETMRGLNREGDYTKVMGRISSIGFAVPIILTVLIPFFVSISHKIPFAIALVFDLIGLWAVISLVKPPVTPEQIEEVGVTNFRQVMKEGWQLSFFRHASFLGILAGILMAVGVFRAPYQAFLEVPVIWFGVLFGLGRALASVMLLYSEEIKVLTKSIEVFYRYQLVIFAGMILLLGVSQNVWLVLGIFIFMNAFQWGLSKVKEGYLIEIISGSKFKATLLSVVSQINTTAAAIVGFALGFVIDILSYQMGFLFAGVLLVLILLPLYRYISRNPATT